MSQPREGEIAWVELRSPDHGAALPFYRGLLGWDADDDPGSFAFLRKGGLDVGAAYTLPGGPHGWLPYVASDHAGRAVERATAAGATVISPARQVEAAGWSATIADGEGTQTGIWQPAAHPGFRLRDAPGSVCRTELHTRRPAEAARLLGTAFGWTADSGPTETYSYLRAPGRVAASLVTIGDDDDNRTPAWFVFFGVHDVGAAIAASESNDGRLVHGPVSDRALGEFAVLADPQGLMFGLLRAE